MSSIQDEKAPPLVKTIQFRVPEVGQRDASVTRAFKT